MSNVNCIRKNNTDYMYEDTAGRTLIGEEQETLTASQAYVVGDLFWYQDTLYRVTVDIASGGTITVDTNCVATTVSDELKSKATTTALADKQNKTLDNSLTIEGTSATTVEGALGALNDKKAGLTDLAPAFDASASYAVRDCVTYNGGVYRFKNAHSGAWSSSDVDLITVTEAGGHDMIDNANFISLINAATLDNTDAQVVSAYAVGKWSNSFTKRYIVEGTSDPSTSPIGETGIGTWFDGDVEDIDPTTDEADWLEISDLIDIEDADDIDVNLKYDPASNEPITLGGYIIDTDTGKMCIKFGNTIATPANARVAINITYLRNEYD